MKFLFLNNQCSSCLLTATMQWVRNKISYKYSWSQFSMLVDSSLNHFSNFIHLTKTYPCDKSHDQLFSLEIWESSLTLPFFSHLKFNSSSSPVDSTNVSQIVYFWQSLFHSTILHYYRLLNGSPSSIVSQSAYTIHTDLLGYQLDYVIYLVKICQ